MAVILEDLMGAFRNRAAVECSDDLFITGVSRRILDSLPKLGWKVFIEDDYADFKDYICSRQNALFEAFTSMNIVVMTPDLDPTAAEGVEIHFLFYADPARLPADRNAYGRALHKDNCRVLQDVCEDILRIAAIPLSEPGVIIRYRPKNNKMNFDGKQAVNVAYEVDINYWITKEI